MELLAIFDDKGGYVTTSRSPCGQVKIDGGGVDGQKSAVKHRNHGCFGRRALSGKREGVGALAHPELVDGLHEELIYGAAAQVTQ